MPHNTHLKNVCCHNQFIQGHFIHAWRQRISDATLYQHAQRMHQFSDQYLIHQTPIGQPRSVDELTADAVVDFITGWLPRHLEVSARQIKSYLASVRKYVHFMDTEGYLEHAAATEILQMPKQDREELTEEALAQAAAEAAPPVNLRARLKDLEARWAAMHDAQTKKKAER
jgi:hypothetical protein